MNAPAFTARLTRHAASGCHTADTYALTDSTGATVGTVLVNGTTHPSTPVLVVTFPDLGAMVTRRAVAWMHSPSTHRDLKVTAERTARILAAIAAVNNLTAGV